MQLMRRVPLTQSATTSAMGTAAATTNAAGDRRKSLDGQAAGEHVHQRCQQVHQPSGVDRAGSSSGRERVGSLNGQAQTGRGRQHVGEQHRRVADREEDRAPRHLVRGQPRVASPAVNQPEGRTSPSHNSQRMRLKRQRDEGAAYRQGTPVLALHPEIQARHREDRKAGRERIRPAVMAAIEHECRRYRDEAPGDSPSPSAADDASAPEGGGSGQRSKHHDDGPSHRQSNPEDLECPRDQVREQRPIIAVVRRQRQPAAERDVHGPPHLETLVAERWQQHQVRPSDHQCTDEQHEADEDVRGMSSQEPRLRHADQRVNGERTGTEPDRRTRGVATEARGLTEPAARQPLYVIQAGRGIAALLVVLFHATSIAEFYLHHDLAAGVFIFGYGGVDLFFVVSGFVIMWVHGDDIGHLDRLRPYLIRRLIRIYPVFWIVAAVLLPIYSGVPPAMNLATLVRSLLLLDPMNNPIVCVWPGVSRTTLLLRHVRTGHRIVLWKFARIVFSIWLSVWPSVPTSRLSFSTAGSTFRLARLCLCASTSILRWDVPRRMPSRSVPGSPATGSRCGGHRLPDQRPQRAVPA